MFEKILDDDYFMLEDFEMLKGESDVVIFPRVYNCLVFDCEDLGKEDFKIFSN